MPYEVLKERLILSSDAGSRGSLTASTTVEPTWRNHETCHHQADHSRTDQHRPTARRGDGSFGSSVAPATGCHLRSHLHQPHDGPVPDPAQLRRPRRRRRRVRGRRGGKQFVASCRRERRSSCSCRRARSRGRRERYQRRWRGRPDRSGRECHVRPLDQCPALQPRLDGDLHQRRVRRTRCPSAAECERPD